MLSRAMTRLRSILCLALLALVATTPARAALDPVAETVVRRYLAATGGEAAFAADTALYLHGSVEAFGFRGEMRTWSSRPGKRWSRTVLGPFDLSEGSDGVTAWRTEPTTGRAVALADHDLDRALESGWFESERWAEPGQGGGRVELGGTRAEPDGRWTALVITPPDLAPGGAEPAPRTLWFSDATGLHVATEWRADHRTTVSRSSDWRMAAGRLRAWRSELTIVEMPGNRVVAAIDTLIAATPPDSVPFTLRERAVASVRWLREPGRARLWLENRVHHLWLRVSVDGGAPQHFLFDTGASVSVLDSAWAARHGIRSEGRMQAEGIGSAGSVSFARLRSLRVEGRDGDGIEVGGPQVAVLDLATTFDAVMWRPIAGILGHDVLSRFVVTVDPDDSTLTLSDPALWTPPAGEPLSMVMNGTVPAVRGAIDGSAEGLFRLDLGSNSTVDLHAPFVRRHGLATRLRSPVEVEAVGVGGAIRSRLGRLTRMSLGPYEWDDPIVVLSGATTGAFASEEFAGNIGNRVLERFRVTLDYAGRRVFLEPGAHYRERDHLTRCGARFVRLGDRVVVADVLQGSVAERAGLRAGDELLVLDERAAASLDLPELVARLDDGEPESVVRMTLRRSGRERRVRLRLSELVR